MASSPSPAGAPSRRSRCNLTYREKLAIIQKKENDPTWTQRDLAVWAFETFGLASLPTRATISNLLRGKDKVLNAMVPLEFRSARQVKHPELDRLVLRWVHAELQCGRCMTRSAIQSKAVELAQEMPLPPNASFSKGWIRCFMKRHALDLAKKKEKIGLGGKDMLIDTTAKAIQSVEYMQTQQVEVELEEEEIDVVVMEIEDLLKVEEDLGNKEMESSTVSVVLDDVAPIQKDKSAMNELLLDWIAVPGNYSRWWLLKGEEEKEPLCHEINVFLYSHGKRDMNFDGIRRQLTSFGTTFLAAHTWIRQKKVTYPLSIADMSIEEKEVKKHVLQMCPYYERLVSVLAPYVNYANSTAKVTKKNKMPTKATVEITAPSKSDNLSAVQARDASNINQELARPIDGHDFCQQSFGIISGNTFDNEIKAQKRHLFKLECTRLQSKIETRNIKLVLEKTLARKKLLDAGICCEEVDRLFSL